jgi:hypothetical protein
MMTVLGRGARVGHSYTMTALLAGIEGGSCTTTMLAGREKRRYTMTALLAGAGTAAR